MDVVCGIIFDSSGNFLICLRPRGKALAGHWEFPGGKIECGESPVQALIRELREELAVEVSVGGALAAVEWSGESGRVRLLPYFCTISSGVPRALEHQAAEWCPPSRLRPRRWAPADMPILEILETMDFRTLREKMKH